MDVIIVGAGPTGLMAAYELSLGGASVLIVEAAGERNRQSRATGIQPRTAEVLQMRGLLEPMRPFFGHREAVGGHFAALPVPLDTTPFGSRFSVPVSIPQYDLERSLEAAVVARPGVQLMREAELVELAQTDNLVQATIRTPTGDREIAAAYLIGCDGGHSRVRRLAGFDFPGRPGLTAMVACDIRVSGVDDEPAGHFSRYLRPHDSGVAILSPLGGGLHRLLFGGVEQQGLSRDAPILPEEVQRALTAACGPDVQLLEIVHASRFSDASRQVTSYRSGRVLLAGDAAHIHLPAGGQGINLGIQDAVNLGWKLAAVVRDRLPESILDSYQVERHPVAARVLTNTRAQGVLMGAGEQQHPDVPALRDLLTELLKVPDANHYLAGMISGLDTRYPMPGAPHPLLGVRLPDHEIADHEIADGRYLSDLQHAGHGLLLEPTDGSAISSAVPVDVVRVRVPDADRVLVRPDGHVCGIDDEVDSALTIWFGATRLPAARRRRTPERRA